MAQSKGISPNQTITINAKKPYRPAANTCHNTQNTWALVQATLAKGPTTRQQLFTVLQTQVNHACFVSYALQRNWLVPTGKTVK